MDTLIIDKEIIKKYDIPGPRYTSYPTAPTWSDEVTGKIYIEKLQALGRTNKSLSLYVHIPFCQSMCSYCGCNVIIRKNDEKHGNQYIKYLSKELNLIAKHLNKKMHIRQLHWGGGTPTFLSESQLQCLFKEISKYFIIDSDIEVAIEIDPRTIDKEKIKTLKNLGFNRLSMGVQDFSKEVQEQVNRIQPFELVKEYYDFCREQGFESINFDLIYGLPKQTVESFSDAVKKVISLRPDRIALYSFAYIPWLKKHQKKIDTSLLPTNDEKLNIFLTARELFLKNGYESIAMDHFALKEDELAVAFNKGVLYRNFMGYTIKPADEYIGLGLTSIGYLENTFVQNVKTINDYYDLLEKNEFPVERGKILSLDDRMRQWVIINLMCQFKLDKNDFYKKFHVEFDDYFIDETKHIQNCIDNKLLSQENNLLVVTNLGKIFIRNICMGFDWYLRQEKAHKNFSKTI